MVILHILQTNVFPPPVFSFVVLQFPATFPLWGGSAFCFAEGCPVFERLRSPLVSLSDFFCFLVWLELIGVPSGYIIEKAMGSLLGLCGV